MMKVPASALVEGQHFSLSVGGEWLSVLKMRPHSAPDEFEIVYQTLGTVSSPIRRGTVVLSEAWVHDVYGSAPPALLPPVPAPAPGYDEMLRALVLALEGAWPVGEERKADLVEGFYVVQVKLTYPAWVAAALDALEKAGIDRREITLPKETP